MTGPKGIMTTEPKSSFLQPSRQGPPLAAANWGHGQRAQVHFFTNVLPGTLNETPGQDHGETHRRGHLTASRGAEPTRAPQVPTLQRREVGGRRQPGGDPGGDSPGHSPPGTRSRPPALQEHPLLGRPRPDSLRGQCQPPGLPRRRGEREGSSRTSGGSRGAGGARRPAGGPAPRRAVETSGVASPWARASGRARRWRTPDPGERGAGWCLASLQVDPRREGTCLLRSPLFVFCAP